MGWVAVNGGWGMGLMQQYIELTAEHVQSLVEAGHRGKRNAWQELAYIESKHEPETYQLILKAVMKKRIG